MKTPVIVGLLMLSLVACVSKDHVADEYSELYGSHATPTSQQTVIFFLIDGLPLQTFSQEINHQRLPQISQYFLAQEKKYYIARTIFPSLTWPAVSSLLSESSIAQNGVYGNVLLKNHEELSYERPEYFTELNNMLAGKNIFARLKAKGLKTVSLDYGISADTDAHISTEDEKVIQAYLTKDYATLDKNLIRSLEAILTDVPAEKWPDFIFVHLVGVDFTSHDQGPESPAVTQYLEFLDTKLAHVFKTLQKNESAKKRQIVALMSSDHGFDAKVERYYDIEKVLSQYDSHIQVLNEGRFVGMYFPTSWKTQQKSNFMQKMVADPNVDRGVYQDGSIVLVNKREQDNDPDFIADLTQYFQSGGRPDALLISKSGVSFRPGVKGQHGGPNPQEIFVPLLLHNATLHNTEKRPFLRDLLKFM